VRDLLKLTKRLFWVVVVPSKNGVARSVVRVFVGLYVHFLIESTRRFVNERGLWCFDVSAINRQAQRSFSRAGLALSYFALSHIHQQVVKRDVRDVAVSGVEIEAAQSLREYMRILNEWDEFAAPPSGFRSSASALATALDGLIALVPHVFESSDARAPHASPPKAGDFLLRLFLPKKDREALPGDLEEEFSIMVEKFGLGRARFWYWTQVITSIAAVVSYRLCKLAALAELFKFLRR